jgi:predicted dehydrogenase
MTKQLLRVAVVGIGKMGLLHTSVLSVIPDVEVVGICEKSSVTRKLLKKVFRKATLVDDVSQFSELGPDAVFVTTPISSHYPVAKTIYSEDIAKHIFIEKPLCSSFLQSKELCNLATNVRGVNMVGYLRRFMVTFKKARELLLDETIGDLVSFKIGAFSSDFYGITGNPKASMARGGVLRDLGSYSLDLALWSFGDFHVVSSNVKSLTGMGAQDSVHATVERKSDGIVGDFSVSWCAQGYRMAEVDLFVKGTKGTLEVNDDKVRVDLGDKGTTTWHRVDLNDLAPFWIGAPEYYREDVHFIKSIIDGSVAEPSFGSASKIDEKIEIIEKEAGKSE